MPVSRLFAVKAVRRGVIPGRRISRRVSIAGGGLLAFISGSVASQDPALSYAARPFYLRPIWQRTFNSMRLAHFVDYYTRPLYPKLIVFARIPEQNSWDYLGSRITAGKWPPFQIRSSIRPLAVPLSSDLLLFFFETTFENTIRKHFSNFFSRCVSRRRFQLINSRMDVGIRLHRSLKFLFRTVLGQREREGERKRELGVSRNGARSIEDSGNPCRVMPVSELVEGEGKVRVGSAPLTPQFAICRRQFIRAGIERRNLRISDHGAVMRPE